MKQYSKMAAAVINLAEMLDEVVAQRKAAPVLAGVGGNILMATNGYSLDANGNVVPYDGSGAISMVTLS